MSAAHHTDDLEDAGTTQERAQIAQERPFLVSALVETKTTNGHRASVLFATDAEHAAGKFIVPLMKDGYTIASIDVKALPQHLLHIPKPKLAYDEISKLAKDYVLQTISMGPCDRLSQSETIKAITAAIQIAQSISK